MPVVEWAFALPVTLAMSLRCVSWGWVRGHGVRKGTVEEMRYTDSTTITFTVY